MDKQCTLAEQRTLTIVTKEFTSARNDEGHENRCAVYSNEDFTCTFAQARAKVDKNDVWTKDIASVAEAVARVIKAKLAKDIFTAALAFVLLNSKSSFIENFEKLVQGFDGSLF